jgi:hypothetical protein
LIASCELLASGDDDRLLSLDSGEREPNLISLGCSCFALSLSLSSISEEVSAVCICPLREVGELPLDFASKVPGELALHFTCELGDGCEACLEAEAALERRLFSLAVIDFALDSTGDAAISRSIGDACLRRFLVLFGDDTLCAAANVAAAEIEALDRVGDSFRLALLVLSTTTSEGSTPM